MLEIGKKEAEAVARVLQSGRMFRYGALGSQCSKFECRYSEYLGARHVLMTSSGTTALTAALAGLGIGPGDEVLVPACTYMASAVAVLEVGAIPVVVDIDASLTLDPSAVEAAIGPCTRAVMPVHMWGLPCNMRKLMKLARAKDLLVIEDACQAVGGGYRGRKLGTFGEAGAFSFNYFKNMTCGEGGAVVTNDERVLERAGCMIDCCNFYWNGRKDGSQPFTANGSRASEIEGAIMNVQLSRIDPLLRRLRKQKERVLAETGGTGLVPAPRHAPDDECGTNIAYTFPSPEQATAFAVQTGGVVAHDTGRHVYTAWDPILDRRGSHHKALNPYTLPANRRCRKRISKKQCARSLDILRRTVLLKTNPAFRRPDVTRMIRRIQDAAKAI